MLRGILPLVCCRIMGKVFQMRLTGACVCACVCVCMWACGEGNYRMD